MPYFEEESSLVCLVSTEYLRSLLSDAVKAISFELGDQANENFNVSRSVIF